MDATTHVFTIEFAIYAFDLLNQLYNLSFEFYQSFIILTVWFIIMLFYVQSWELVTTNTLNFNIKHKTTAISRDILTSIVKLSLVRYLFIKYYI